MNEPEMTKREWLAIQLYRDRYAILGKNANFIDENAYEAWKTRLTVGSVKDADAILAELEATKRQA